MPCTAVIVAINCAYRDKLNKQVLLCNYIMDFSISFLCKGAQTQRIAVKIAILTIIEYSFNLDEESI